MGAAMSKWQVCIHEAAHAVVFNSLGVLVLGVVANDERGCCTVGGDGEYIDPTLQAIATAAGPLSAEEFSDAHPGELSRPPARGEDYSDLPPAKVMAAMGAKPGDPSDEQYIAQWAIHGYESEPERWARRVYWVQHEARCILRRHRAAVIDLATRLFHQGSIIHPFQGA